jgi:hypothetical protein
VAVYLIASSIFQVATESMFKPSGLGAMGLATFTLWSAVLSGLYALAGLLLLTMKKWAGAVALLLLIAVVVRNVAFVGASHFPLGSFPPTFALIVGNALVMACAVYVGTQWRLFR